MKNKTFFLLFALILGFATVNAQQSSDEKYEYAIVEFHRKMVYITTTEGQFQEREIKNHSWSEVGDRKELLGIIKEMNDKGWNIVSTDFLFTQGNYPIYFYHMQKKRTN